MTPLKSVIALVALSALAMVARFPAPAQAATLHVPSEYPTIQAGIDASTFGDVVLVAPGTYTDFWSRTLQEGGIPHTSCAFLKDGVVLKSEEGPETTTIDARYLVGIQPSVVEAAGLSSEATLLEGFTITNRGRPFWGLILYGTLTVRNCVFRDLDFMDEGSGTGVAANGDLVMHDCLFEECYGSTSGGIYHANGTIALYNTVFRDCGSIGVFLSENGGGPLESAWIEGCTFENCGDGGGLSVSYIVRPITVRNCVFLGNVDASTGGGGLTIGGQGPKLVEGCRFIGNETIGSNGSGGAILIGRNATIQNNTFWGNAAYIGVGGSAISFAHSGPYALRNNIFASGIGEGGALEAQFGGVVSTCNVFWENEDGFGVYFTPGPTDREVDPQFCNATTNDFTLSSSSPCLPEDPSGCGLIGAFGLGCGAAVSVDQAVDLRTWGAIKGLYR